MKRIAIALLVVPALLFCEHTLAHEPGAEIQERAAPTILLERPEQEAFDSILSQFEPGYLLPRSFSIPEDDPWYGDLVNIELDPFNQVGTHLQARSWIYDAAMVTIILAAMAENDPVHFDTASGILKQLRTFSVRDKDPEPGTIEFSYQIKTIDGVSRAGTIGDRYLRSGAIAWVGYACTFLLRTPGFDTHPDYAEIRAFAHEIAGFIEDLQVLNPKDAFGDGARFGSVKGGRGNYNLLNWEFEDSPVAWVSTEHNIDIYFFLRDLYHITEKKRFGLRAEFVRRSLLENHWLPAVCSDPGHPNCPCDHRGRFQQGVADPFKALDLFTWGALFLKAIGRTDQAEILLGQVGCGFIVEQDAVTIDTEITGHRNGIDIHDRYNNTYEGVGPFSGAKPYLEIPNDTNWTAFNYFNGFDPDEIPSYPENPPYPPWPDMIWTEGEAGRALAVRRVNGVGQEFNDIARNLRAIQDLDPLGGLLYTTRTQGSLSFHAWPSVTCSAWQIIALTPIERFWDADREVRVLPDPIFVPLTYGTDEHLTPQGRPIGVFKDAGMATLTSQRHALHFQYDLRAAGNFAGIRFGMGSGNKPFNPSRFTHIELEIWGAGSPPHVKIDRLVNGTMVEGTEYPWPAGPLSNTRTLVRIPLTVFTDVTPETAVQQFVLLFPNGSSGMSGTLWIDNIAFLRDEDADKIPEWWEEIQSVDNSLGDPDGDGVTNLMEYRVGTNPHRSDSDFDGLPDGWELEHGLDPADGTGNNGASGDPDGDGVTNLDEYLDERGSEGPRISVDPLTRNFGEVQVGTVSTLRRITIRNDGSQNLKVSPILIRGADRSQFTLPEDTCSHTTLAPTRSCRLRVGFKPTETNLQRAFVLIRSNDPDEREMRVTLRGTGTPGSLESADISVDSLTRNFGEVRFGTVSTLRKITISNDGTEYLNISLILIRGANRSQFTLPEDTCSGATLAPTQSCRLRVGFEPTETDLQRGLVVIRSNDPDEREVRVTLRGTGVTTGPCPGSMFEIFAEPPDWRTDVLTRTPLTIQRTNHIAFTAAGSWTIGLGTTDPDGNGSSCGGCAVPNAPEGALIGKIGASGSHFSIGSQRVIAVEESGALFLGANDNLGDCTDGLGSCYADNQGSVLVCVVTR